LPRRFNEDSLIFKISPPRYRLDLEALNKAVAEPFWEFLDRGGKRWRPVLFLLICKSLGVNSEDFLDFAVIPEVIHNGTLIADDVEDQSDLRRGKPCTYRLFGLDIAINLSNLMFFLPMLALVSKKKKISSDKANKLYETYVMGRFAESLGIAFQIQDDVLDLVGEEFAKGKGGLGKDITEGKLTLMVIHTLQNANASDRERLIKILEAHTSDERQKKEAIDIIKKYGSIEYAKKIAAKMVKDSWSEADRILPPSEAKKKLKNLVDYLIERNI